MRHIVALSRICLGYNQRIETASNKTTHKEIKLMETANKKEPPIRIDRVMELTGYTRSYICKLVHYKKIPYYKPTGKGGRVLILESEVIDFLTRNRQSADYELSEQADAILNGETRQKK